MTAGGRTGDPELGSEPGTVAATVAVTEPLSCQPHSESVARCCTCDKAHDPRGEAATCPGPGGVNSAIKSGAAGVGSGHCTPPRPDQ
jgi:hypothetical protein